MGNLEKAQIFIMDATGANKDTAYDPIDVCFNPKEYALDKGLDWEQSKALSEAPIPEFKAPKPMGLAVTLQFDTYEERVSVREKYVKRLERLVMMKKSGGSGQPDKKANKPPIAMFVWGRFAFKGVAESLSQKYTMFLADGTPVRAECALKMRNVSDSTIDANDKAGDRTKGLNKGTSRQYSVKDGDRLDLIAAKELGDPSRWIEIAALNGIDDPTKLSPTNNPSLKLPEW